MHNTYIIVCHKACLLLLILLHLKTMFASIGIPSAVNFSVVQNFNPVCIHSEHVKLYTKHEMLQYKLTVHQQLTALVYAVFIMHVLTM